MSKISERLEHIKEAINSACSRAGRDPGRIKLVVVTKSANLEAIKEVIRLGFTDLGENRVQQLKRVSTQVDEFIEQNGDSALPQNIDWHMVGHLQRNKVRSVLGIVSLIHSVDTLRLAEEINASAAKLDLCPRVLLQVNTSNEAEQDNKDDSCKEGKNKQGKSPFDLCYVFVAYQHVSFTRIAIKKPHQRCAGAASLPVVGIYQGKKAIIWLSS